MTEFVGEPVKGVLRKWADDHIILPGARPESLQRQETDMQVLLPDALRALWLASDGTNNYDGEMLRFLPIGEWVWATSFALPGQEHQHERCVVFAEFSVWAHEYALRVSDGAVVLIYGGPPVVVATSFSNFLVTYLTSVRQLFPAIP